MHRKARLVLVVSRGDERSVALGRTLAALYAARLPESRASLARARDDNDLLRLLGSKQLDVALAREELFTRSDAPELRALAALGEQVLVCREDLPKPSAYLLASALAEGWGELDAKLIGASRGPRPAAALSIPLHPGALEYYRDHP